MSDMSGGEEPVIGGNLNQPLADVRAALRIDQQQLRNLRSNLDDIRKTVEKLHKEMKGVATETDRMARAIGGSGLGGGGAGYLPSFTNTSQTQRGGGQGGGIGDIADALSGAGRAAIAGVGLARVGEFLGRGVRAMDERIDRGYAYASGISKLNMLSQQMYGLSENQVMNQQRRPLTDYRLGGTGISDMLQFQTAYGVQASPQLAQSIEGMRAAQGYGISTQQVLQQQRSIMDPAVANRMFYLSGVSPYQMGGGGITDPLQMQQQLIKNLGLTDERLLRGAFTPGSVTRARMADMGLDEQYQTQLLQYAQANQAYRKKGGTDFYDPSNPAHRKVMGVEETLASEQAETERLRVAREEQFSRRQLDNFASLERSNQQLIRALGSLEDKISGLIGARTSTRPWQKAIGSVLQVGGMAAMATGGPIGVVAGGLALGIGSAMSAGGDPPVEEEEKDSNNRVSGGRSPNGLSPNRYDSSQDSNIMVPYGWAGKKRSLSSVKADPNFQKMDPNFRNRLVAMMRANPNVGIGEGIRSTEVQRRAFLSRHTQVGAGEDYNVKWDGKYWKRKAGQPPTAPPGRSYHEIGLAADLQGDLGWVTKNAKRFGLTEFSFMGEPWHVQPDNIPNARSQYKGGGATEWDNGEVSGEFHSSVSSHESGNPATAGRASMLNTLSTFSLSGSINDLIANSGVTLSGGTLMRGSVGKADSAGGTAAKNAGPLAAMNIPSGGKLTPAQVAKLAYDAGFRGKDLITAVAIAGGESGWDAAAHNPNANTGDNSYGLFQINMLGKMGPSRRASWGLSNNEELFDPVTNLRAAFALYTNRGGNFKDWSVYKNGSYKEHMATATDAVSSLGLSGDPMPMGPAPRGGGGGTIVASSPTITVAPTINFNGMPNTGNLEQIARTVTKMLEEQVMIAARRAA
jgi:hypothetical protein